MRIFLTGATGYIGSAVARALSARHEVTALVRPDADTKALRDLGVVLVSGNLHSLPSLREQIEGNDAFVHTAFSPADDHFAVDVFTALPGHVVYTSGCWMLGNTATAHEGSPVNPLAISAWRAPHEERVLGSGGAVVRPGCVYGGKQSLCADWFIAAEQNRPLRIIGDGQNRWAMVHLDELADFYLRAAEQRATGVLHAVDDSHDPVEASARAVAPDAEIEYVPLELARTALGNFADALAVDQLIASSESRQKLGWSPRRTFVSSVAEQWQAWRSSQAATD